MDNVSALSICSTEKALFLPEVLTCILSWLKDERYTLRSVRLVSKQFLAIANQFFRIHLTADYAIEHNCIQEAAAIIGGLTLTFPRIIAEHSDIIKRYLGIEPQDNIVNLTFCSMVARSCYHLERVKIVLEGSHSKEISQLFSCLFSQDPKRAAVFRIKSLQFVFGVKFVESILRDIRDANVPDFSNGIVSLSEDTSTESTFSRLEELRLSKKVDVAGVPLLYRILQLKICPEVAAATSFLGPVYWNSTEREAHLSTILSMARRTRTLRVFDIPDSHFSVDQLYVLKEQAPRLEEVSAMTISNTNESITNEAAFERNTGRSPGTLRLKKLTLLTVTDRETKLLLCQLLDPPVLESYVTQSIYGQGSNGPPGGYIEAGHIALPVPSNTLNELLDRMQMDPVPGWTQPRFLREFGFGSCDKAIEHVNWLQRLKDIPRLYRLEMLSLPLTIAAFLDIFDPSTPLSIDSEGSLDPVNATTTATTTTITTTTEEKQLLVGPPQLPLQQFPACSSLLSLRIRNTDDNKLSEASSQRFANYLVRNLTRLRNLDIPKSGFTDFTFMDAIAPPVPPTPAPPSPSSSCPTGETISTGDGGEQVHNQDVVRINQGLYRLESLVISFNFLDRYEFQKLPRSERVTELIDRRHDIILRHRNLGPGTEGYDEYQLVEALLQIEAQRMLLEAQPIQMHEDRVEQFMALLDRFQRKTREGQNIDNGYFRTDSCDLGAGAIAVVTGLKKLVINQIGMPNEYVEKLKAQVALRFPELDFRMSSGRYKYFRIPIEYRGHHIWHAS